MRGFFENILDWLGINAGGHSGGYHGGGYAAANVPEIDAGSGLLAMAAVMAAVLLVWELRRRRARA